MLKVVGHIYSENKEGFDEIVNTLTAAGYEVAYDYPTNATIIKEVDNESEDSET